MRRSVRHGGLKLRTQRRERIAWMGVRIALRALFREHPDMLAAWLR